MKHTGYAATKPKSKLSEHSYQDSLGPGDVNVQITHCGICHSDIHLIDDEWGMSEYPFIPGHEIVGVVKDVGENVSNLEVGQRVGVGWQCNSCEDCEWCVSGEHENCPSQQATCVGRNGGFADSITVNSTFAIPIPDDLESAATAPLMCGGITVYKPLKEYADSSSKIGVIGIGGLGHFALQFADAMGCDVTALSTSPDKADEAKRLGADRLVDVTNEDAVSTLQGEFDVIINTAPAKLDWDMYLSLLRPRGTFVQVGAADSEISVQPFSVIAADKQIVGSHVGSPAMLQKMLAFCERHDIGAYTEEFAMSDVNEALDRARSGDARYRVVLKR